MLITQQRLKELLTYCPETGIFHRIKSGKEVKSQHSCGYIVTTLDKRQYYAHRLAWLYVHGVWPEQDIDHINGARSDNRICNIRAVTTSENLQNKTKPQVNGTSGYLGVHWHKHGKKWQAKIHYDGKSHSLGLFACPKEAHEAYVAAKRKHHKTCTI